ncbi:MAG: putative toxin-antitoxin system toxin component, PIN family [Nitrososphaera sp.]|nr:putative toxin-antitoxin system toxin component, PIN family [Nitrososphaera sp.]
MKIVLDTNVLISALIKEGKPRELVSKIIKGKRHELIMSEEILVELAIVANEPKIQRYVSQQDIVDFLRDIAAAATMVEIKSKFNAIDEDPDDDIVLRTAHDARASHIVSGDGHLLTLQRFRRIAIVSVDDMLKRLRA